MRLTLLLLLVSMNGFSATRDYLEKDYLLPKDCKFPSKIVIFSTNDHHGAILGKKNATGKTEGGLARQSAWIKSRIAQDRKESKCSVHLLVSAGDVMAGDIWSDVLDNRPDFEAMHRMGFIAMTPGNHEFDRGVETFLNLAKNEIRFPVISSNIRKADGTSPLPRALVLKIGARNSTPYTFALLGVTTEATGVNPEDLGKLEFRDPIQSVRDTVTDLKKQLPLRAIGVLAHLGGAEDRTAKHVTSAKLAEAMNGEIDFIIDGHDHKLLKEAVISKSAAAPTVIVEAGYNSTHVSVLNFTPEPEKRLTDAFTGYEAKFMDSSLPEDPAILSVSKKHSRNPKSRTYFQTVLTKNETLFEGSREKVRKECTNLCRLVLSSYRHCAGSADLSFLRPSSIRNSIYPGEVTRADLANVSPFTNLNNTMVKATLTGRQLEEIWDFAQSKAKSPEEPFFHFSSGLKKQADGKLYIEGRPLSADASYRIGGILYDFETVLSKRFPYSPVLQSGKPYFAYDCIADYGEKTKLKQ